MSDDRDRALEPARSPQDLAPAPAPTSLGSAHQLMAMQGRAGNQAMTRLLAGPERADTSSDEGADAPVGIEGLGDLGGSPLSGLTLGDMLIDPFAIETGPHDAGEHHDTDEHDDTDEHADTEEPAGERHPVHDTDTPDGTPIRVGSDVDLEAGLDMGPVVEPEPEFDEGTLGEAGDLEDATPAPADPLGAVSLSADEASTELDSSATDLDPPAATTAGPEESLDTTGDTTDGTTTELSDESDGAGESPSGPPTPTPTTATPTPTPNATIAGEPVAEVTSRREARRALQRPTPPPPSPRPFSASNDRGIRQWRSQVATATTGIAEPDLEPVRSGPGRLRDRATETDRTRRAERPDLDTEASEAMPPVPQSDDPLPEPPPDPVPAATALLTEQAERRLPDQTLPAPVRSPDLTDVSRNIHIGGLLPGERPPPPSPDVPTARPETPAAGGSESQLRSDMAGAAAEVDRDATATAGPTEAPHPVTLTDDGPPTAEPMPPELQADMGEVLARLLSAADQTASRFVDAAMTQAFHGGALARVAPELGQTTTPTVEAEIRTELNGVAEAAGLDADALANRAAELRTEADAAAEGAEADLELAAGEAESSVSERATEEQQDVAGHAAANQTEIEQRQEAATGDVDEAAIEREASEHIRRLQRDAAVVRANQRIAKETRERELTAASGQLAGGYRTTGQQQMRAIRAAYEHSARPMVADGADDGAGAAAEARQAGLRAAIPTSAWSRRNAAAVGAATAEAQRALTRLSREATTALDGAEERAVEMVRTWRDDRLGTERSWWERLLDMFLDWGTEATESTSAWAEVRDRDSRDRAVGDFALLAEARDAIASGNAEQIAAVGEGLDASQRAVLQTFFSSGGDAVAAVSAGMLTRLGERRIPEITEQLRSSAEALDDWTQLDALGSAQTPGFNAQVLAIQVHAGVDGIGTDEAKIYSALGGKTRIQTSAIRGAYRALGYGDIDEDLADDLSDAELHRAQQMMEGDQMGAQVAELRAAVEGWGTDEAAIMSVLRNRTPEERAELIRRYEEMYPGSTLSGDLRGDLGDTQFEQATAMMEGDQSRADALALREAMEGAGTDEDAINQVYTQIRNDVEAQALRDGMSTTEVEAEIRRRNADVAAQYGTLGGGATTLAADLESDLGGAELDLAQAYASGNQTDIDAASIRVEERALFDTDDDRIVAVLRHQRERAEQEAERDLRLEWQVEASSEGWSAAEAQRRWDTGYRARADAEADRRAEANMDALEETYDRDYGSAWGPGALQVVVAFSMGGEDQDVARDLIAQHGRLRPEQEIEYAIRGAGTDEDAIRRTLRDPRNPSRLRSPAEIQRIREAYEREHGTGSFDRDIMDELDGRDAFDIGDMLRGEPQTPEERLERLRAREEFDRGNAPDGWDLAMAAAFPAYGVYQLASGSGIGQYLAGEEGVALDRSMTWAEGAYADYERALAGRDPADPAVMNDPAVRAARAAFERRVGGADAAIDDHRRAVDSAADTMATVAGIAAGIAVAVATAGTATPALAAAAAAAAATAATVATKAIVLGDAYGLEDIGTDLAVGGVDIAAAVLTVGVGNALMRASALARLARGGVVARVGTELVSEGVEGALGAIPSAMAQVMLDDNTWRNPNPMLVIAQAAGQAGAMGFGMSAGMSGLGQGYSAIRGESTPGVGRAARSAPEVDVPASAIPDQAGGHNPITDRAASRGEPVMPPPIPDAAARPGDGVGPTRPDAPLDQPNPGRRSTPDSDAEAAGPRVGDDGADADGASRSEPSDFDDEPTLVTGRPEPEPHVGDDGIVDLDDPRNAHLIDGMVGQLPDDAAFDAAAAREFFEGFVAAHPDMEVGLVRNSATGEFLLFQGSHERVSYATLGDAVADLVPPGRSGRGRWVSEMHSHPIDSSGFTPESWRVPSAGDVHALATEADIRGGPARHEIRVETPTGPDRVVLTFDPSADQQLHVDLPLPDGTRLSRPFRTIDDYADWFAQRFGYQLDDVPADFPGRRRAPDFDDEPTQVTRRPDFDDEPTQVTQRPDAVTPPPDQPAPRRPERSDGVDTDAPVTADELAAFRQRLETLGRRPGASQAARQAIAVLDGLDIDGLAPADLRLMMSALEETVGYRRPLTRDRPMREVDLADDAVSGLLDDVLDVPALTGHPDWQRYVDLVRRRYGAQGSLEIGRSPRTTDAGNVSGTNRMRADFLAAIEGGGGAIPEAAEALTRHLDEAIARHGSDAAAVAAGDAVWIDPLTGARASGTDPGAALWPADPIWGVWRVDHVVELQHGGGDHVGNYVAVPQRMHAIKSAAMNEFGRRAGRP